MTNTHSGATVKTVAFKLRPVEIHFAAATGNAAADPHLDQLVSVNVGKRTLYLFEVWACPVLSAETCMVQAVRMPNRQWACITSHSCCLVVRAGKLCNHVQQGCHINTSHLHLIGSGKEATFLAFLHACIYPSSACDMAMRASQLVICSMQHHCAVRQAEAPTAIAGEHGPVELAFQPGYGDIERHLWFGIGHLLVGFSSGARSCQDGCMHPPASQRVGL